MNNIIAYISSRNNYEMLQNEVLNNVKFQGVEFINIDDNSSFDQQSIGRKICIDNKITYLNNEGRGLFMAAKTAIDFISKNRLDCKYVFWLTHDCYPITEDFFIKINKLIESGKLDQFGCVGFNTIWKKFSMSREEFITKELEGKYCGALGRAVLVNVPGVGWYRSSDFDLPWNVWGKSIAVESVVDMNMMINVKNFNKYIVADSNFQHFCWGDDLCLQFLNNNVYNLTLSHLYVYHDQSLKSKYNIPENSLRAAQSGDRYYFCHPDQHLSHWKDKWKFDRNWQNENNNNDLKHIKNLYSNTLINLFIEHDYLTGPVKIFNL